MIAPLKKSALFAAAFVVVALPAIAAAQVEAPATAPAAAKPALPAAAVLQNYEPYGFAVLQGLDKVTGRTERFELPIGGNTRFGLLYVTVRACYKTPPEELPESVAFIEIDEVKPGESSKRWYSGWMFAAHPSLAALEHPVYDVGVVDCKEPLNAPAADDASEDAEASE